MTSAIAITFVWLFVSFVGAAAADRTIGGKIVSHTEWRTMKPQEAVINIADLEGFSHSTFFLRTQQRTRDNVIVEQRLRFNGMDGYIWVQRAPIFDYATTKHFNDQKSAQKKIDRFYGKRIRTVDYEEARRIYRYGTRGGWLHVVRDKLRRNAPDRTCIFASLGFLDDRANIPSTTADELYDTVINFRDCSGRRTADDVEAFLNDLRIVRPEYNRTAR